MADLLPDGWPVDAYLIIYNHEWGHFKARNPEPNQQRQM